MKWIKLKKGIEGENQLRKLGLLEGIPFLGYAQSWENFDFNPEGIRECYYNDDNGIISARWNASEDIWVSQHYSQPTHVFCLYKKPKGLFSF
jgi:hypothetical protein